ncbi:unnamed protein product [Trichobilharzia regenti]|nr:unnamed protein product [Trichobilharzia regenti]
MTYYPPRVISSNNLQTRTWLVGNVMNNYSSSTTTTGDHDNDTTSSSCLICLCTADGNMLLIDPTRDNDTDLVLWSIQVHTRSELFSLGKIKLTVDAMRRVAKFVYNWWMVASSGIQDAHFVRLGTRQPDVPAFLSE